MRRTFSMIEKIDHPLSLAWLFRTDLRSDRSVLVPEDFKLWWAIDGRQEYPLWANDDSARKQNLFVPMSNWPCHGRFGMSRFLHYLLTKREDLRKAFDVHSEVGLWDAVAWQFTHGLREYRLFEAVDEPTLKALDESPPFLPAPETLGHTLPAITWLMFFVWRCDSGLQSQFDLRTAHGQMNYFIWFFSNGVPNLKVAPLVSTRLRAWLIQPVPLAGLPGKSVARFILLLLASRADLRANFDIRSTAGQTGLLAWADTACENEPGLRWLLARPAHFSSSITPSPPAFYDRPFGVNLIGFAFGELGIGEDVRMAVAACEAAGIPFKVVNINPGGNLRQADQALAAHVTTAPEDDEAPYAFNVFCLTGFDTVRVYLERGLPLFAGHYNIGWWPWELPVWPKDWQPAFDLVDEVWAAATFTQRMYTAAQRDVAGQIDASAQRNGISAAPTFTPVTLMPLPASVARVIAMTRKKLGLPARRFLFLYVFDFNSYLARKNPFAAVKAFRRAFVAEDASVGLVLKTMNGNPKNPVWRRFLRECAKDARIVVLDRTLDRGEVLGLIDACDAYVSLHRSEGFGRTLAEAMLFGKPVVGTDFSGNADFLQADTGFPVKWKKRPVKPGEYPFVTEEDQAWWAEPDIADAVRQMEAARAAAKDKQFAKRVKSFAEKQFSLERIGALMKQRLEEIATTVLSKPC